jgi:uncharacterized protein (TIGR03086 family)
MSGFRCDDRAMTISAVPITNAPFADTDPRWIFGKAVGLGTAVVRTVRPDDLHRPTPCDEMDVRDLLGHLIEVLDRVAALGRGDDAFGFEPKDAPDDRWADAWSAAAHRVQDAWTDDAVLAKPMALPWQQGTGAEILLGYVSELTVHTWDLAKALGVEVVWEDEVLQVAWDGTARLPAEGRYELFEAVSKQMGFDHVRIPFADPVPVADDAPLIDRLVAWNGRRP